MPLELQDHLLRETPSPYQTDCVTNSQTMVYGPGATHHMCCTPILQAGEITLEFNSLRMFLCTVNRFLNQAACLITDADSSAAESGSIRNILHSIENPRKKERTVQRRKK